MIKDPIIEPFFIDVEEDQFTLRETCIVEKGDNAGNTYEMTRGYFTTLEACIRKIIRTKVARENETLNLEQFLTRLKTEYTLIDEILKKLDNEHIQNNKTD